MPTDIATEPTTAAEQQQQQRQDLLDSEREANNRQARNFKEDALSDKVVSVKPDGTGPTTTDTFDAHTDREKGSGNPDPALPPARRA